MPIDGITGLGAWRGASPADALQDYDRLKLELARILRTAKRVAEAWQDHYSKDQSQRLLVRLAEDRFNVVVVGQFSRGKSSLMNAVLGVDRLPTGVVPLTSVITTVSYGDRERVLIHWKWTSYPSEISLSELAEYVTQDGNPANEKRVALAAVQLPVELLRAGFSFVDTPGIASAIAANTATTEEFLPEADAVVFVTSFESPLTEPELDFLAQVRRHVRKVFVVLNKSDLTPPEQQRAVLDFAQERLRELFGDAVPRVYAVSAREGLAAKQHREPEALTRSGLPRLEAALVEFLHTEKARECLRRVADRTADLLAQQALDLHVSQLLARDTEKANEFERELADRVQALHDERDGMVGDLRRRLRQELPEQVAPELDRAIAELEGPLERWRVSRPRWRKTAESDPDGAVHAACLERLTAWLAEHQRDVERLVRDAAHEDVRKLGNHIGEMTRAGARLVGAAPTGFPGVPPPEEMLDELPVTLRLGPLPRLGVGVPRWLGLLPAPLQQVLNMPQWRDGVNELLNGCRDALRTALSNAGDEWANRLGGKLREMIEGIAARQRDSFRRQTGPAALTAVEQCRAGLAGVVAALGVVEGSQADAQPVVARRGDHMPRSDVGARCCVCRELERTLFEFMRRRQYDLSTSEAEQAAHAERRGFCALHTWHYEAVASPQGICSAYPPVLFSLARGLHSVAEQVPTARVLREGVQRLLPHPGTCRACQLLAAAQRNAVRDVLRMCSAGQEDGPGTVPPLCLPHLHSVLLSDPAPRVGRLLVQEQARVLERLGEEMQRYALKHEALRRHLASERENAAYETGLARLVGVRNLAAPWKDE
jgi:predicted GTPase